MKKFLFFFLAFFAFAAMANAADINEYKAGDTRILRMSDGPGGIPVAVLRGDETAINKTVPKGVCPSEFVTFLVAAPGGKALVDTGNGPDLGGKTLDLLKQAGYSPEDITDVVLTHMHFDHISGLLSNGKKTFPNAKIHADAKEWDYWKNYTNGGAPKPEVVKKVIELYQNDARLFKPGENPLPFLKAIPAPGHTPGHTAYLIEDGGKSYILAGDFMHCLDAQAKNPDIFTIWDVEPQMATQSRKELLSRAAKDGSIVLGGHFPQPGAAKFSPAEFGYDYTTIMPDK